MFKVVEEENSPVQKRQLAFLRLGRRRALEDFHEWQKPMPYMQQGPSGPRLQHNSRSQDGLLRTVVGSVAEPVFSRESMMKGSVGT